MTTVKTPWKAPAAALGLALGIATILLIFLSPSPLKTLGAFFLGPFSQVYFWGSLLNQAALLSLTGLGIALAFSSGSFNLGGEGQVYAGGMGAVLLALALPPETGIWTLPLVILAGTGAGAAPALVSGSLKRWWKVDELITSFLVSAAIIPLIDGLLSWPWLKAGGSYLIMSREIPTGLQLAFLAPPSRLHAGSLLVPLILILSWIGLYRTPWGYRLRMTGQNRLFARYSGIETRGFDLWPMAASGAFHGLAGALAILGIHHGFIQSFSAGLGWNGISVALMARNHPLLVLPAALVLAWLDQGSRSVVIQAQFPFELGAILQAIILLVITSDILIRRHK